MSTARQFERLTVDEYLQREPLSEVRHEFVAGVAYAMVGTTTGHNLIAGTIFSLVRERLRDHASQWLRDQRLVFYFIPVCIYRIPFLATHTFIE